MATKSVIWGFSEPETSTGVLESKLPPWRLKAELFMALNSYGNATFEDLIDNEFLGKGTSFKVHACTLRKNPKLVFAVKRLIRSNNGNLDRLIEILRKEFQALSYEPLRETTTIVNIRGYEWKHSEDLPSIVIEYADYGTLDKFLCDRGSFVGVGWDLCRSLCLDVAVALDALHANGIIHGDIKLENVLVYRHEEKYATAKVSDFGHSIFDLAAGESASYLGTPIYNPPEVLRLANGNSSAQMFTLEQLSKCDVWCFGLMVWCTINAGKSYFQDRWLSQGGGCADRLDFLMNESPDYLQLASLEFVRNFEALFSAPNSLKLIFTDLLWKCLHGDNEDRCTMRDASILLDSERIWPHPDSDAFKRKCTDLEKTDFRILQIFDLVDSDIPWHFRKAFFEDLLKTEKIQRDHLNKRQGSPNSCYVTSHEMIGYYEEQEYGTNQAWEIAICYATGFGVDASLESMLKYMELVDEFSGYTRIFLNRIKDAHGKALQVEDHRSGGHSWQHDEWFAESIHTYQNTAYEAQRLNMSSARFKDLYFDIRNPSNLEKLLNVAVEFPNEALEISCRNGLIYSRPFLHFAVDMNDRELLRGLIERGVDINQQDAESRTALFEACAVGNLKVALLLLAAGANPSLRDSCGAYPLHLLVFFRLNEIRDIGNALVNAGAEPNVNMDQGKGWSLGFHGIAATGTPLRMAVSCRNAEAIRVLLHIGADVNYRRRFESPLDIAVAYHLPDICRLLIENGAKIENYWVTGKSPLHGFGDSSLCPGLYRKWPNSHVNPVNKEVVSR